MRKTLHLVSLALSPLAAASDRWFSGTQEAESTLESIQSDDIQIRTYRAIYSGTEGPWTADLGISWSEYREDYSPVLFGTDESLGEETFQADLSLTRELSETLSGTVRFSAYDGFSDYRSIWISEFYRQFFGAFPEYDAPDPHGHSFGAGVDWDYLPGTGKAVFNFGYGRDEIAPGWSFDSAIGTPAPGLAVLDTVSGGVRVEQVINPWLKTGLDLSARQTTGRSGRYGVRNSWAAAAGNFGFQLAVGYTGESPSFNAVYGSALVEWNFLPQWSAHAGYRVYQDGGEIEASGFNALAPAIESHEIFGGIRWDSGDLAIGGGVGFLKTNYEALSEDNEFFGNLYRDREWWNFRISASLRF